MLERDSIFMIYDDTTVTLLKLMEVGWNSSAFFVLVPLCNSSEQQKKDTQVGKGSSEEKK